MSVSKRRPPSPPTLSDELATIPFVTSLVDLYGSAKSSPWVGVGVRLAEWSCVTVAEQVNMVCADKVSAVNYCAGGYVASMKDRFPILRKPTSEVVDQVSESVKSSAKVVLHSLPGQTFLIGLDGAISASSYVLAFADPSASKKGSATSRQTARFKDAPKDKPRTAKHTETSKSTQTPSRKKADKTTDGILKKGVREERRGNLAVLYSTLVVSSLQLTVASMVKLRSALYKIDGRKHRSHASTGLTPEKKMEIAARRKVSPKKRLGNSVVCKIKMAARRLLGIGNKAISLSQADIRNYMEKVCDDHDEEKKRKYDEIQTDPDSASSLGDSNSEDSLADFNMNNYKSDEDSDYTDSEGTTDSMEYMAGDTESDISFETKHGEMMIKEHPISENGEENAKSSAPKKPISKPTSESRPKVTNGTEKKVDPQPAQNGVHNGKASPKVTNGGSSASTSKSSDPAKSSSSAPEVGVPVVNSKEKKSSMKKDGGS